MNFTQRQRHALALLGQTGMMRNTYAPPWVRLCWRLGLPVRPPHFMGFWRVTAATGLWFGTTWALLMWMTVWSSTTDKPLALLVGAATSGIFIGLSMACIYAWGRKKHALPRWEALGNLG